MLQGELTVNGDFETGEATGWTYIETEISSFGAGNVNGDWVGSLFNEKVNSTAAFRQENIGAGLVGPGDTIEVSFKARGWDDEWGHALAELSPEVSGDGSSSSGGLAICFQP